MLTKGEVLYRKIKLLRFASDKCEDNKMKQIYNNKANMLEKKIDRCTAILPYNADVDIRCAIKEYNISEY